MRISDWSSDVCSSDLRIAEETDNAIWANQFDNIANRKSHIFGTAEEIWDQMDGRIDGFTCAAGPGGTIAGTGLGLKAKDEAITVALTDPPGAGLYNYYNCGELKPEGDRKSVGAGKGESVRVDIGGGRTL